MSRILCVDDDPAATLVLEETLRNLGHEPLFSPGMKHATEALGHHVVELVITAFHLPDATGLELLESVTKDPRAIPVVVMTDHERHDEAALALSRGAVDYLTKPLRKETLRLVVKNAIEIGRLKRENDEFRGRVSALQGRNAIVGGSSALREVLEVIEAVAPTRATVLIEGESGTGKEVFARAIHERSPRRDQPLVTINCAALPEGLIESALFGHEKGAFTGAGALKEGAFERADGGTLLLDEITEMRIDLQAKLLRALQEQEFERVGGSRTIQVDVRVIATTNRDLRAEVEAGRFRRDLYYRLSVVPIRTPPLRARLDDLPLLIEHFVERAARELGIRAPRVPQETIDRLREHPWPGNIRELANTVERAVILTRSGTLPPSAFELRVPAAPPPAVGAAAPSGHGGAALPGTFDLRTLKKSAVERALEATGGRRGRAAELLGISERTLRNMLNRPAGLEKRAG